MNMSLHLRALFAPLRGIFVGSILACTLASHASASFITFEAAGADAASITPTRDAFRSAIGGGTVAGAAGDFGGLRREINWDAVPGAFSDPNQLPANFFNVNSPRGAVFSTPGDGFLVSSTNGAAPAVFGFPNDFQFFSPSKLFTAINSNITDVNFFVPGTTTAATIGAFGVIFSDAEVFGETKLEFYNINNVLMYSRSAPVAGNQGFSFLGALGDNGERIARVRVISGANKIVSNGVLANQQDDVVAMDDFIYSTPAVVATPEPASVILSGAGLCALALIRRRSK